MSRQDLAGLAAVPSSGADGTSHVPLFGSCAEKIQTIIITDTVVKWYVVETSIEKLKK